MNPKHLCRLPWLKFIYDQMRNFVGFLNVGGFHFREFVFLFCFYMFESH